MICAVCHREAKGYAYSPRLARKKGKHGNACCMKHLNIIKELDGMMIDDATPNEINAALYGGEQGGEYLDWLGKTNLAALTADEWKQFLFCVVGGYTTKIRESNEALTEDNIPF